MGPFFGTPRVAPVPTIRLSIVQAVRTEKAAKNADQEYIQDVAISLNKTAGEQQASQQAS